MKKIFAIALAAALAASVTSCGGKSSDSDEKSSKTSTSQETPDVSGLDDEDAAKVLELVTKEYEMTGLAKLGSKLPEEFDKDFDEVRERINSQPLSISGDGTLKFDGKEYQLIPQSLGEETAVLSVKGSGFSLKKFQKGFNVASKEYAGVAAVEYEVRHGSVNGEDWPTESVNIYISTDATTSYAVTVTLSPKEEE